MHWDTWALLFITALCLAVIVWSIGDIYREGHPPSPPSPRLSRKDVSTRDSARVGPHRTGRHRAGNRTCRIQPLAGS